MGDRTALRNGGEHRGLILVFAAARTIYYPFWAAGASRDELGRSWGGPSVLGATVAHWAVAAATIAVM